MGRKQNQEITNDQTDSQKYQQSELINEERSDLDEDIVTLTTDQPDNQENVMKDQKSIKNETEAESIVEFYASIGDVLHFPKFEDLKNRIIVKPMELIGDCR